MVGIDASKTLEATVYQVTRIARQAAQAIGVDKIHPAAQREGMLATPF